VLLYSIDAVSAFQDAVILRGLTERARWHLNLCYRPKTRAQYDRIFRDYIAFSVYLNIRRYDNLDIVLCYLTYLYETGVGISTLQNTVSALRAKFILYSLSYQVFEHPKVKMLLKSFLINRAPQFKIKNIISVQLLHQISDLCQYLSFPKLFRAIFMLAFFSFLRISHFAAETIAQFDHSRQLLRADVIWANPGAHIIIRWAKNMQDRSSHRVVQIPFLQHSSIFPVTPLRAYITTYPLVGGQPLFAHPITSQPITQSCIRRALSSINVMLGLPNNHLPFHTFRRSGATLAFDNNITLQNIQAHGGWKSSAVWSYLTRSQASVVPLAFQSIIS